MKVILDWLGRHMTEQLKIGFIALAGAVTGGLVTGFYSHARDLLTRPRLSLDYADDKAHFVDLNYVKNGVDISAVYVRVRARNGGRRVAKGCRVFLTGLEEVQPAGTRPAELFHDSLLLGWPGADFAPRDIPRGVDFYVDVVRVSKHNPDFLFCVKEMFGNQAELGNYRGTYRFHILITAENADPAQCTVDVTYHGDWHNLRAVAGA